MAVKGAIRRSMFVTNEEKEEEEGPFYLPPFTPEILVIVLVARAGKRAG